MLAFGLNKAYALPTGGAMSAGSASSAGGGTILNQGSINADGGQILLTAQAAGNLLQCVVNNTGVIQAQTVENRSMPFAIVDKKDAISMHPVLTTNLKERRPQRLATPTPLDNRIFYGCINVPANFFANVVRPAFTGTNGIVYVLPETRLARVEFASYDVDERARMQTASQFVPVQITSGATRH